MSDSERMYVATEPETVEPSDAYTDGWNDGRAAMEAEYAEYFRGAYEDGKEDRTIKLDRLLEEAEKRCIGGGELRLGDVQELRRKLRAE